MSDKGDVTGFAAYRSLAHLLFDPLAATRRINETYGDLARLRPSLFNRARPPLIHVVGAAYAEEVFRNYALFENGGIIVKGYKGSTHNCLREGYFSANGEEYDHYIKLFGPLFRRKLVDAAFPVIARVVKAGLAAHAQPLGNARGCAVIRAPYSRQCAAAQACGCHIPNTGNTSMKV